MTRAVQPHVSATLQGVHYRLVFDFEAIAEAEEILDRALVTGLTQKDVYHPSVTLVRAMLFGVIHREHPKMTFDSVKALVTRDNLMEVWAKVLEAWLMSNPEPEVDSEEADPLTAQS